MLHFFKGLSVFIFFISCKLYAYLPSEGTVTASYGLSLNRTNFNGSDQLSPPPLLGGMGLLTNGDLNDVGSLEIALLQMHKIYYRNLNNRYLAEKTELIHVSMGYRRWLNELYSVGLGFYGAYSIGDYQQIHSDSNVHLEIDTSARDTTEYGLDFSLQRELWSKEKQALTLDLRYSYSISNKENEKGDHYTLLLAYRVVVQEKNAKPEAEEAAPDDFVEPRKTIYEH